MRNYFNEKTLSQDPAETLEKSLSFLPPGKAIVHRLSDKRGEQWNTPNSFGDEPDIDFAISEPIRCLDAAGVTKVKATIDENMSRAYTNERCTSLRGVDDLINLFYSRELEEACSKIAGVPLVCHPARVDFCHVNLQQPSSGKAVDSWHLDYTPFVCVIMIDCGSEKDACISTDLFGSFRLSAGEMVLLQGSHVLHQAEKSEGGVRVSVVVSFVPSSFEHLDMTRHTLEGYPPYSPDEPLIEQFRAYREANIDTLTEELRKLELAGGLNIEEDIRRAKLTRKLEHERAQLEASY